MSGARLTPHDRWEQGIPHDRRSLALALAISTIDREQNGDSLQLEFGGDGDNGEQLLYILDVYFAEKDTP